MPENGRSASNSIPAARTTRTPAAAAITAAASSKTGLPTPGSPNSSSAPPPTAVPLHRRAAEYFSAARARSGRASRTGRIRCHASSRLAGMNSVGQYPSCGR